MDDLVDRVLNSYHSPRPLDPARLAEFKPKISRYLESLASAGHRDAYQLTMYGLAYLKELHEGPDPRCTGC